MLNLQELFLDEAYILLNEVEISLLNLERDPGDEDQVARLFRSMHTMKSSASMANLIALSGFAHQIETILVYLRNGLIEVSPEFIDAVLSSIDVFKEMLGNLEDISDNVIEKSNKVLTSLNQFVPEGSNKARVNIIEESVSKQKIAKFLHELDETLLKMDGSSGHKLEREKVNRIFKRIGNICPRHGEEKSCHCIEDRLNPFLERFRGDEIEIKVNSQVIEFLKRISETIKKCHDTNGDIPAVDLDVTYQLIESLNSYKS